MLQVGWLGYLLWLAFVCGVTAYTSQGLTSEVYTKVFYAVWLT